MPPTEETGSRRSSRATKGKFQTVKFIDEYQSLYTNTTTIEPTATIPGEIFCFAVIVPAPDTRHNDSNEGNL